MTEKFYFSKVSGWSFEMTVEIKSEKHRTNFMESMKRKGFDQVEKTKYDSDQRLRSMYASMFKNLPIISK